MNTVKIKISAYLASHHYLRLGTVTDKATPQVHTVGYVSEDCTVYFVTDRKSRKAANIFENPAVAYAVDENYADIMTIQGVQIEGKASVVTMETEAMRLLDRMAEKSAQRIIDGLEASKRVPFERVLFAIGIRYVGETVAKTLVKKLHTIENIQKQTAVT